MMLRVNPPGVPVSFEDLGEACGRPRAQGRIPGGVICKPGPTHVANPRKAWKDRNRAKELEYKRNSRARKRAAA